MILWQIYELQNKYLLEKLELLKQWREAEILAIEENYKLKIEFLLNWLNYCIFKQ